MPRGIGPALSAAVAGLIAANAGCGAAFLLLAAAAGLVFFRAAMPETRGLRAEQPGVEPHAAPA